MKTKNLTVVKVRDGYYMRRDSYEAYYSDDTVWVDSPLYRVIGTRGKVYKEFTTEDAAKDFIHNKEASVQGFQVRPWG